MGSSAPYSTRLYRDSWTNFFSDRSEFAGSQNLTPRQQYGSQIQSGYISMNSRDRKQFEEMHSEIKRQTSQEFSFKDFFQFLNEQKLADEIDQQQELNSARALALNESGEKTAHEEFQERFATDTNFRNKLLNQIEECDQKLQEENHRRRCRCSQKKEQIKTFVKYLKERDNAKALRESVKK